MIRHNWTPIVQYQYVTFLCTGIATFVSVRCCYGQNLYFSFPLLQEVYIGSPRIRYPNSECGKKELEQLRCGSPYQNPGNVGGTCL